MVSLRTVTLASLVDLALGILLHVIGLATPEWLTNPLVTSGLFKSCFLGFCYAYDGQEPDKVKACEAFALLGLILALAGATLAVFHVVKPMLGRMPDMRTPLFAVIACALALFSIIVCVIIWGASVLQEGDMIGYSCILSIVGGFFILIGGVGIYFTAWKTVGYASVP